MQTNYPTSVEASVTPSTRPLWSVRNIVLILVLAVILMCITNILVIIPAVFGILQNSDIRNNPALLQDETFIIQNLMTLPVILGSIVASIVSFGGVVLLVAIFGKVPNWRKELFGKISPLWLVGTPFLIVLALSLNAASSYLMTLLVGEFENPQAEMFGNIGLSWASIIFLPLFGGILIAFAEELFFRGFLYRAIRDRWGVLPGLIASSLIFAVAHFIPLLILPLFMMGLLLAWLYERSRSLWVSIAVHAGNNIIAFAAIFWALSQTNS